MASTNVKGLDGSIAAIQLPDELPDDVPRKPKMWIRVGFWTFMFLMQYLIGLTSFNMTVYLNTAAQAFNGQVQYNTVAFVQSTIFAVGNTVFAKFADVFGRPNALALSVASYTLGTIILSTAQNIGTLSGGVVFLALGNTGVFFLTTLVVADLVPGRWRCTVSNLLVIHTIINFGVAPIIVNKLVPNNWRWGIGMFAIMMPIVGSFLVFFMVKMTSKVQHTGFVKKVYQHPLRIIWSVVVDMDLLGLLFLTAGFTLLLLPLTISGLAPNGYKTGYIIAMFVLGAVSLVIFGIVEQWVPTPLLRVKSLFRNYDVILATAVASIDSLSVELSFAPCYNWVQITYGWSVQNATYFLYAGSLSVVIFGVVAGYIATLTRHYKWLAVTGAGVRILAIGLMINFRGAGSSAVQVVIPQVMQGLGNALMTANLLVAAQISIRHADLAVVTGLFLMCQGLAAAVGDAIVGALQTGLLASLQYYLPNVDPDIINDIYGGGPSALGDYPLGTPIRDGAILAWGDNMRQILVAASIVASINFVVSLLLRDRVLPDKQNAVDDSDTDLPVPTIVGFANREEGLPR